MRGIHEARGVRNCLGDLEPFFAGGTALGEHAQLGITPGEVGTGKHGGQHDMPKALVAPRPIEGCHALSVAVYRPTVVPLACVSPATEVVRQRLADETIAAAA